MIDSVSAANVSNAERFTRIGLAADDLAEDPGRREEFRQQWGGSPRVWWGIQKTAISLGEEGGVAGDFLTEACGEFLQ